MAESGKRVPTLKQQEAYKRVFIDDMSQEEAAEMIGVKQPAVSRRLLRLKKIFPKLFISKTSHIKRGKPFLLNSQVDSTSNQQF